MIRLINENIRSVVAAFNLWFSSVFVLPDIRWGFFGGDKDMVNKFTDSDLCVRMRLFIFSVVAFDMLVACACI